MSVRLALLRCGVPGCVRRRMLDELAEATAVAFGAERPVWDKRAFDTRLAKYADFTAREAGAVLARGCVSEMERTKGCLFSGAETLGKRIRRLLGVCGDQEALEAFILLYKAIGIEMRGSVSEGLEVRRCFFSRYYDEAVCELIGSLDRGMASGLFGGASFEFETRLTEGAPCCRALFDLRPGAR